MQSGGAAKRAIGALFAVANAVQLDQVGATGAPDGLPGHKHDVIVLFSGRR